MWTNEVHQMTNEAPSAGVQETKTVTVFPLTRIHQVPTRIRKDRSGELPAGTVGRQAATSPIMSRLLPSLLEWLSLGLHYTASAALLFLAHCLLLLMGSEAGGVFDHGRHRVSLSRVDEARAPSRCGGGAPAQPGAGTLPPKPLLVAAPHETGEYPVLVFLHGYLVVNSFYSQMFQHVASHGYIVVAPQVIYSSSLQFVQFGLLPFPSA